MFRDDVFATGYDDIACGDSRPLNINVRNVTFDPQISGLEFGAEGNIPNGCIGGEPITADRVIEPGRKFEIGWACCGQICFGRRRCSQGGR